MSNKNTYMPGSTHHDQSQHLEITLPGNVSADVLSQMISEYFNKSTDATSAHTARRAKAAPTAEVEDAVEVDETDETDVPPTCTTLEERVSGVIRVLLNEKLLVRPSDYTWLMWGIQYAENREVFKNSMDFVNFLKGCQLEFVPSDDTIRKYNRRFSLSHKLDNLQFDDEVTTAKRRQRVAIIKRTIVLMRESK